MPVKAVAGKAQAYIVGLGAVLGLSRPDAEQTEQLIPTLGQNVFINLAMPVLTAIGFFIG